MRIIKNLLSRYWRTGALVLGGLLLIIYISLGFVYWQQGTQQTKLEGQIAKLSAVLSKPLPSSEELRAEYEAVNSALAPMTDNASLDPAMPYITLIVSIAERSGINVEPTGGRFIVPPATSSETKVGGGTYQLISFSNIHVQGDYDNVMAFIADLDSGKTLKTMVLNGVQISEEEVTFTGEEGDRRAEFRTVAAAVKEMMESDNLSVIPNPINFAGGVATNVMGDDPDTILVIEGFPDIATTAANKGYSGNATPRGGFVLYKHDKILSDNRTQFTTVNYINTLTTKYYYTSEADGTVRQFDGATIARAKEYTVREASSIETVAAVTIDIYTKRRE